MTGVDRGRSSRRGWAITAAVLAATVCLACWPRPTLGVLGIVVGTGALLAGLRGLLAEHRSQAPAADTDPDASGRAPETARTHPDDDQPRPADQGGDHPDASGHHAGPAHAMLAALAEALSALPAPAPRHPDAALRGRVAAVLLARIKQAVITDATPFGPGPVSTLIAATEYDLADVVLAELAPELDALTAARAGDGPWLRAYREDLIAAQDAIQRIERQAQDWARLAPPNDVGCTPDDTAYANAGRVLLDILSTPVSTEGA